jgi:prepilin-type N-terminal cleavage/methylation domain-containing protein
LQVLAGEGAGQSSRDGCAPSRSQHAFSLIEMIGVLAVIAVLATALAPSFVRQMDKTAGDQESAAMKSFGDALQRSIMRYRYIPSDADWATNIATELGVDVAYVTTNPRQQPRFFLIDPNLSIAGAGLPYRQTNSGSVNIPSSPRVMILSSVGTPLPAVTATAANFTNIWNAADGTVPTAAPAFAGWNGTGNDLNIQRVDLSPLFVRLQLSWVVSSHKDPWPKYSIDSNNWATARDVTNGWDVTNGQPTPPTDWPGYFIQNSILFLYNDPTKPNPGGGYLDSQQILIRNNTFNYDQDTWRGSIGGEFFLGGLDIASVVDRYLAAYPNARAQNGTNQQAIVVQSMITFMDRYDDWAGAGFPTNTAPTYVAVQNAQVAMKTAVQGHYQKNSFNPIEVPCQ